MVSLIFSHTAEYALRAMSCLALQSAGRIVATGDLVVKSGVPGHYLQKIMRRMVAGGLAASAKGRGGGYKLGRPAERISFLDILELAGYNAHPGSCVYGREKCDGDHPCPLHEDWSALNGKFLAWARANNLAGIAQVGAGGRKI